MQGVTYPINVRTEGLTITLQDETGKILNNVLSPGKELTISNSSINKLVILSGEVMKIFQLLFIRSELSESIQPKHSLSVGSLQ